MNASGPANDTGLGRVITGGAEEGPKIPDRRRLEAGRVTGSPKRLLRVNGAGEDEDDDVGVIF